MRIIQPKILQIEGYGKFRYMFLKIGVYTLRN